MTRGSFIPNGLAQMTDELTASRMISENNQYLTELRVITVFNIDPIMLDTEAYIPINKPIYQTIPTKPTDESDSENIDIDRNSPHGRQYFTLREFIMQSGYIYRIERTHWTNKNGKYYFISDEKLHA